MLREIIACVVNISEYSVSDCQCLQRVLGMIVQQTTADVDEPLFPNRLSTSEDNVESACFLANADEPPSPRPQQKTAIDGALFQQPVDKLCPVKVILERCVPAWPKYAELVEFFGLGLAGVAERWADGNGPLAMHVTGPEVARLVEAVFERTGRRDAFVQQLRHNPSVHGATVAARE